MSFYNLFNYGFWSIEEADEFDRIAKLPYSRGSTDCDYKATLYAVALLKKNIPAKVLTLRGRPNGVLEFHAVVEYDSKGKIADLTGILGGHKFKRLPEGWQAVGQLKENGMLEFCHGYIQRHGSNPDIYDAYEFLRSKINEVQ